jgi:hypothetical protein
VVQTATATATPTGLAPSQGPHSRETWSGRDRDDTALYTLQLLAPAGEARIQRWTLPRSVALTTGILVSFFSSAY